MTSTNNLTAPNPTDYSLAPGQCFPGDPRVILARAMATAGQAIAAVRPDQMTTSTPCDVYDVRGLLGHFLIAAERIIGVGQNGNPFAVDEHMEPLADDAWTSAWEAKSIEAANAWADDASLLRPTPLPWAPLSGAQAIGTYIAEFSAHTWDLATATGQTPTWDDEVLAAGLASIKGSLPATGRPEMFAAVRTAMGVPEGVMPDPYGPAVSVPDDAPLIDQLVAYNGRNPGQTRDKPTSELRH